MEHELKTSPEYFKAVRDGIKTFEVRKNDRGFSVGDILVLREFELGYGFFWPDRYTTSPKIRCEVIYMLDGGKFGIEPGYCVMGINILKDSEE
jgi:hypothetical protein